MAAELPRSPAPSAAETTVKVSLDEWAIVDRDKGVELMTDGLSGCVAVGIRTRDRLALTHVYSDAIDRFGDYRDQIGKFVASVGAKADIAELHIMHNGNPVSQKHNTHLQGMIEDHLVRSGLVDPRVVYRHVDNGCTVADGGFYGKRDDNKALYLAGYTNTALEGASEGMTKRLDKAVEHGGFKGSTGYLGPADVESAVRDGATQAHTAFARYAPQAPVLASPSGMPPSGLPSASDASPAKPSGDEALFNAIVKPIRDSKLYGLNASPIARSIAEQVAKTGADGIDAIKISADGKHIGLVTQDRRDFEFTVSGRTASLAPASLSAPHASSSTPSMPASSVPVPSAQPPTLYEQAVAALTPHRESLKLSSQAQFTLAAGEIASRANHDGLTAISRIERVEGGSGGPALVAHQDGPSSKRSDPLPVETLQRHAGVDTPSQGPSGPDKHHFPIM